MNDKKYKLLEIAENQLKRIVSLAPEDLDLPCNFESLERSEWFFHYCDNNRKYLLPVNKLTINFSLAHAIIATYITYISNGFKFTDEFFVTYT
ncbi:hypothetical protein [Psychrobacter aestuarii]|uniref:Uncharacterized protein n=1 Tax=Psychrobacter aestuarii TaxID=556327 RepID=A0ABP3FP06_9GAMM|nr:hypothetical protein [Psychrobacter aestuarii]